MTVHTALAVAALALSAFLLLAQASRLLAAVALAASALEVLMAFGVLVLRFPAAFPLQLLLGGAIALPALLLWLRSSGKAAVSGSAVLGFVGLLQVTLALLR